MSVADTALQRDGGTRAKAIQSRVPGGQKGSLPENRLAPEHKLLRRLRYLFALINMSTSTAFTRPSSG